MRYTTRHPLYRKWNRLKAHGVCQAWEHFPNFVKWWNEMGHTFDRYEPVVIDPGIVAKPGNVFLADITTPAHDLFLPYKGYRLLPCEWALLTGLPEKVIRRRWGRELECIDKIMQADEDRVRRKESRGEVAVRRRDREKEREKAAERVLTTPYSYGGRRIIPREIHASKARKQKAWVK